jgi:hypothetical protein
VADKDDKKDENDVGQPGFDPKPVQLGGESIVDRLMPYRKKILIAILLGFAVWGVIAVVFYFKNSKREKNTEKIASVLEVAGRDVRAPDPAAGSAAPPAGAEPTFATNKDRAVAVIESIAKTGATTSPAHRGSLLMQAGQLDEAITEYKKGQVGRTLDNVLAREGLGIAIETKAEAEKDAGTRQRGLEEALAVFQTMQPDEKGPRRAYALYHQGRILDLLQKKAEAKAALEKAKELGGEGPLADLIDERLASLGAS